MRTRTGNEVEVLTPILPRIDYRNNRALVFVRFVDSSTKVVVLREAYNLMGDTGEIPSALSGNLPCEFTACDNTGAIVYQGKRFKNYHLVCGVHAKKLKLTKQVKIK